MQNPAYDSQVEKFGEIFSDEKRNNRMKRLAEIVWETSGIGFESKDTQPRRGAALCFALQCVAKRKSTKSEQEQLITFIEKALRNVGGETHG